MISGTWGKQMQSVSWKKSDKGQVVAIRSSKSPAVANDVEIIQINPTVTHRSFPALSSKISIELVQFAFGFLDALVLFVASCFILPEAGRGEIGVIAVGIFTFIVFKAYMGGYSKHAQG